MPQPEETAPVPPLDTKFKQRAARSPPSSPTTVNSTSLENRRGSLPKPQDGAGDHGAAHPSLFRPNLKSRISATIERSTPMTTANNSNNASSKSPYASAAAAAFAPQMLGARRGSIAPLAMNHNRSQRSTSASPTPHDLNASNGHQGTTEAPQVEGNAVYPSVAFSATNGNGGGAQSACAAAVTGFAAPPSFFQHSVFFRKNSPSSWRGDKPSFEQLVPNFASSHIREYAKLKVVTADAAPASSTLSPSSSPLRNAVSRDFDNTNDISNNPPPALISTNHAPCPHGYQVPLKPIFSKPSKTKDEKTLPLPRNLTQLNNCSSDSFNVICPLCTLQPIALEGWAAVVMCDVSGFSNLASALADRGPDGNGILGQVMKEYLDKIIEVISCHGGDIVKFVGDAVIFYWKYKDATKAWLDDAERMLREKNPTLEPERIEGLLEKLKLQRKGLPVLKAAECCLDLLQKFGRYSVKIPGARPTSAPPPSSLPTSASGSPSSAGIPTSPGTPGLLQNTFNQNNLSSPITSSSNTHSPNLSSRAFRMSISPSSFQHPDSSGNPAHPHSAPASSLAAKLAQKTTVPPPRSIDSEDPPPDDVRELKIHLGIGAGKIFDVHVGGPPGRWEHFVVGEAMEQLAVVLDLAKPGQVALSKSAFEWLKHCVQVEKVTLDSYDTKKFYIVKNLDKSAIRLMLPVRENMSDDFMALWNLELDSAHSKTLLDFYSLYINESALFKLQSDLQTSSPLQLSNQGLAHLMSLSELRQVSTVFIKIGSLSFAQVEAVEDAIKEEEEYIASQRSALLKLQYDAASQHSLQTVSLFYEPDCINEIDTKQVDLEAQCEAASNQLKESLAALEALHVDFGVELNQALSRCQNVMDIVQTHLKRFDGILRQFHVDDKGAVVLAFFGLPPKAHRNDAPLAIEAALGICEQLKNNFDSFSIGVTTGTAYIGGVGGSSRTEYALIGDSINMAARLMGLPAAKKAVICDERTKSLSSALFDIKHLGPAKVKGKSTPLETYQPLAKRTQKAQPSLALGSNTQSSSAASDHAKRKASSPLQPKDTSLSQTDSNSRLRSSDIEPGKNASRELTKNPEPAKVAVSPETLPSILKLIGRREACQKANQLFAQHAAVVSQTGVQAKPNNDKLQVAAIENYPTLLVSIDRPTIDLVSANDLASSANQLRSFAQVLVVEAETGQGLTAFGSYLKQLGELYKFHVLVGISTESERPTPFFTLRGIAKALATLVDSMPEDESEKAQRKTNSVSSLLNIQESKRETNQNAVLHLYAMENTSSEHSNKRTSAFGDPESTTKLRSKPSMLKTSQQRQTMRQSLATAHSATFSEYFLASTYSNAMKRLGMDTVARELLPLLFPEESGKVITSNDSRLYNVHQGDVVLFFARALSYIQRLYKPLIIFSDFHYIDNFSLSVLRSVVELCPQAMFVLLTQPIHRFSNRDSKRNAEQKTALFSFGASASADVDVHITTAELQKLLNQATFITLGSLNRQETAELIISQWNASESESDLARAVEVTSVDPTIIDTIFSASGGNPLFITSLVASLRESSAHIVDHCGVLQLSEVGNFNNLVQGSDLNVIIVSQFDRLEPSFQSFLKIASVLGQSFSLGDVIRFYSHGAQSSGAGWNSAAMPSPTVPRVGQGANILGVNSTQQNTVHGQQPQSGSKTKMGEGSMNLEESLLSIGAAQDQNASGKHADKRSRKSELLQNIEALDKYNFLVFPEHEISPVENTSVCFRNSVIRESIYSTMLVSQRQQLHLSFAQFYESLLDMNEDQLNREILLKVLAHYQNCDGHYEKRMYYNIEVCHSHYEHFAMFEAVQHYTALFEMLAKKYPAWMSANIYSNELLMDKFTVLDRARWYRELGEAHYALSQDGLAESNLRLALRELDYSMPLGKDCGRIMLSIRGFFERRRLDPREVAQEPTILPSRSELERLKSIRQVLLTIHDLELYSGKKRMQWAYVIWRAQSLCRLLFHDSVAILLAALTGYSMIITRTSRGPRSKGAQFLARASSLIQTMRPSDFGVQEEALVHSCTGVVAFLFGQLEEARRACAKVVSFEGLYANHMVILAFQCQLLVDLFCGNLIECEKLASELEECAERAAFVKCRMWSLFARFAVRISCNRDMALPASFACPMPTPNILQYAIAAASKHPNSATKLSETTSSEKLVRENSLEEKVCTSKSSCIDNNDQRIQVGHYVNGFVLLMAQILPEQNIDYWTKGSSLHFIADILRLEYSVWLPDDRTNVPSRVTKIIAFLKSADLTEWPAVLGIVILLSLVSKAHDTRRLDTLVLGEPQVTNPSKPSNDAVPTRQMSLVNIPEAAKKVSQVTARASLENRSDAASATSQRAKLQTLVLLKAVLQYLRRSFQQVPWGRALRALTSGLAELVNGKHENAVKIWRQAKNDLDPAYVFLGNWFTELIERHTASA